MKASVTSKGVLIPRNYREISKRLKSVLKKIGSLFFRLATMILLESLEKSRSKQDWKMLPRTRIPTCTFPKNEHSLNEE